MAQAVRTMGINDAVAHEASVAKTGGGSGRVSSGSSSSDAALGDGIQLTFLIPSNERCTMAFKISDSVQQAKEALLNNWPAQFGSKPTALSELKLLYLGNYLNNGSSLEGKKRYKKHHGL
ncbi:hypothetical protein COEREDRAFT_78900 [Coemansia reversa NRRL 1564]|uniref:UBL3-like ubiquitin domain-containing protein n=1 Tax=Coemansia reversa (strain ATCC 12441 / NRRL 1564) TaxID=763665 RepID=A0A2G5BKN7_COERN|nr:hypothetical protein COEREDRAFT_78900 [Coemansia reversa NRRL 1564]|eukprot:PIA19569.1 hypothetical protein COEREDRAFT_78900 [Coemansia reversa NRRL 1564]